MSVLSGLSKADIKTASDGLLELPEERLKSIMRKEPITSVYHVEQTPFASVNVNAAALCNSEVMEMLQKLKDTTQKKHKREGYLATVIYETLHYLQDTECKNQTAESVEKFLKAMKKFKLTKTEKLMMLNTPPRTELEIQLIVQESEERLSEDDVSNIIDIINKLFPPNKAS